MEITQLKKHYGSVLFFASVLFGLWAISEYSYLLFHSIAEIFSIVVAFSIFVLAWNSRRYADNTFLLFVGIACLFVAGMDLLHTLAYKGMGVFVGYGPDLATKLWVATRFIESASLLLATFLIGRKLRVKLTLAGYTVLTTLLLSTIFYWRIFPTCLVEGQGLTTFKKVSEYIICFLLLLTIVMLLRQRRAFEPHILWLFIASLGVRIASELTFTLYKNIEGFPNLIGHYLKIISFYLIYRAIIQTGLTKPFTLLLRDLKKSEEALKAAKENLEIEVDARTAELRQSHEELESRVRQRTAELEQAKETLEREIIERKEVEEKFRNLADQSPDMIFIIKEGKFAYVNQRCEEILGYKKQELYHPDFDYIRTIAPESRSLKEANFQKHMKGEEVLPVEYSLQTKAGTIVSAITTTKLIDYEGQRAILVTATDITWRKKAEEELRRAHDQWEHTFEAVPDLICILDNAHRIVRVNKAVSDRLGCTPKDLVGRPCYEVMHNGTGPLACCPHTQLLADGQEHWADVHEDRLHGDFSICVTPLRNADGEPTGAVHVAHDITERKHIAEQLEMLARFPSENPSPVLRIASDGMILYSNSPGSSLLNEWRLQVGQEAPEDWRQQVACALDSGRNIVKEITFDNRIVSFVLAPVVEGGYVNLYGRDVTKEKKVEQALRESQEDLKRAQIIGGIGSWRLNVQQDKLTWSDENHRIFGIHKGTPMTYETFLSTVHPDDRQYVDTKWKAGLAGEDYDIEHRIVVGAQIKWVREKAYLEFDQKGQLLGGFGITQDITERKWAEEALRKVRDELEIRVEERTAELARSREALWRLTGRLLSVQEEERRRLARELHDDLTQRLAVLAIDAGKLEQQVETTPGKLRDKLRQMKEQMVKLSADVHDLSRQLHPSIIDDLGLRQAIQSECVNFTKREGIVIRYEHKDIPPKIPRDISICLFRIVQESLRNIARHAKVKEAQVRLIGDDKKITLMIEDSGIGFEPAKARGEAGLGLVSMEERVRLIHGKLRVKSKPGEGTVIDVTAPL